MATINASLGLLCLFYFLTVSFVVGDGISTECPVMGNLTDDTIVKNLSLPEDLSVTTLSNDTNGSCQSDLWNISNNGTKATNSMTSVSTPGSADVFSIIRQGSVSKSTTETVHYALNIVVLPALIAMGICGNIASFRTLLNQTPRKSITVYLMGLSITDTAALVFQLSIWFSNVLTLYHRRLGLQIYAALFIPVILVLRAFSFRTSGFIIVVLSIERAIAVTFPFKIKVVFFNRHPRKVITALCIFILLIHLPYVFQYNLRMVTDPTTNVLTLIILPTEFQKETGFFTHYDFLNQIVMRVLPVALVIVCNLITIAGIRLSQKNRRDLVNNNQEELSVTRLLVTISIIFLICTIPFAINDFLDRFFADYGLHTKEHYLFGLVVVLSAFLSVLNCCVNFIVYMFMSKKFRETFYRTWRCAALN